VSRYSSLLVVLGTGLGLGLVNIGCNGTIGDPGASATGDAPTRRTGPGVDGCEQDSVLTSSPRLRRLTRDEYGRLVRDLLGEDEGTARDFASRLDADEIVGGYAANGVAPVTEAQVELFIGVAEELATRALSAQVDGQLDCAASDDACVESFLARFGRRAFRRPLADDELVDLMRTYTASRTEWGQSEALSQVLTILLASPQLLYRTETGTPGSAPGSIVLTDFELASELSFFLWGTIPDDTLLDAAEAGALSGDALESEVERMLDDPRAEDSLETFAASWLELGAAEDLTKDAEAYPGWNAEVAESARRETLDFVRHILGPDGEGTFSALMTTAHTWGDAAVADLYDAAPPDADGRITLDPSIRAGILTQPSVLASHAYARDNSWVHRGKFVRERFLCQHLPSPPPDVEANLQNDPSRLTAPGCASCHQLMDPIGIGFEAYDAIGRFHPEIESTLQVVGGTEVDLPEQLDGPVELAHALAESDAAHECFATQWYRYAMRRDETAGDACTIRGIVDAWRLADWDVRALLTAIATSEAFRTRTVDSGE
jgi:hypothetical protein